MSSVTDSPIRERGENGFDSPDKPEKRVSNGGGVNDEEDEEDDEGDYEENEEGDDDEDEEDEEDEDEEGDGRQRKRVKRDHKRSAVSRFLDVEAEVSDDEEEAEDEEEGLGESHDFIEENVRFDDALSRRAAADHQRFDRQERAEDEKDLREIAQSVKERYARTANRYAGDVDQVPQRLLMPSVNDPSLWQVRVKPGRERDIVLSLLRKARDLEYSNNPLEIQSAFERASLPGMIYVEARSAAQVRHAIDGLVGIFLSRGVNLVPIDEMASLLRLKKKDISVLPGSWVRIKRGRYQGDLAQVMDVTENGEEFGIKYIPRIDLNPKEDVDKKAAKGVDKTAPKVAGKKRARGTNTTNTVAGRPPQRFFNAEEVAKVYGPRSVAKRGGSYTFQNETFKDGYILKDFRITALAVEDIQPTLEEITRFTGDRGSEDTDPSKKIDLSIIKEAAQRAATAVLQPGDVVEVFEGEQTGVYGVVESIVGDNILIRASLTELEGQAVEVPAKSVRKRFTTGEHVKVMAGRNMDDTGLVLAVSNDVVTFLSDLSQQEVTVFAKDLRTAAEVGTSTNIIGKYALHDFVSLDQTTVAVIFQTARDTFRVLDQHGLTHTVKPHQITMARDSKRTIGLDSHRQSFRAGDNMVETDGAGRSGTVLHVYSFWAFLHNRGLKENGGVFVTQCHNLSRPDSSKMSNGRSVRPDFANINPATLVNPMASGKAASTGVLNDRGNRRLIGQAVIVAGGNYKGFNGAIKEITDSAVRVELMTSNKIISVDAKQLRKVLPNGTYRPLDEPMDDRNGSDRGWGGPPTGGRPSYGDSGGRTPQGRSGMSGSRTPGWGAAGRTPNPYAAEGGRTPAWNSSSRTPNPYAADGGRTPAWNVSSRTPNPYGDSARTPAWAASSRTPNPYNDGGRTPGRLDGRTPAGAGGSGWGSSRDGRTPGGAGSSGWGSRDSRQAESESWGGTSPAHGGWGGSRDGPWGATREDMDVEAEYGAPTPGPVSAPTPGGYSAPTPAPYSAPTPSAYSAPTPGGMSAPTPGMYSAPTPGGDADSHASGPALDQSDPHLMIMGMGDAVVRIVPKMTDDGTVSWSDGIYDDVEGAVVTSLGTNHSTTATIHCFSGPKRHNELIVPVEFLEPVLPDKPEEEAIAIGGQFKGQVVRVLSLDGNDAFVEPVVGGGGAQVYPATFLARLHKW